MLSADHRAAQSAAHCSHTSCSKAAGRATIPAVLAESSVCLHFRYQVLELIPPRPIDTFHVLWAWGRTDDRLMISLYNSSFRVKTCFEYLFTFPFSPSFTKVDEIRENRAHSGKTHSLRHKSHSPQSPIQPPSSKEPLNESTRLS